ncbi:CHAP domain-containing protein [Streptomyces yaanensis]|uniref:CHAP domain-containing protein n=1 Tax=Streptomyces yaanensis TaxID=1142239 RepID=A0ABV7S7T3_9ACTN|nr:CHAP domain-containing protein [Streptomyces sp. CGMCC 4.7035]WNC02600.1 CHAP domain-containing protein [Streptomyces sp. CGMCC 4.7035]
MFAKNTAKTTAVAGTALAMSLGSLVMAAPAQAATSPGPAIAKQALGQYTSTNAEVQKRKFEGDAKDGDTEKNNCNFYTGFWTAKANLRWDRTSAPRTGTITNHQACGTSKGYMYIKVNGVWKKTWTSVKWTSRAWCADFAKYTWYWGEAKITDLNASADSFRLYGKKNHTWHTKAEVKRPTNPYKPKPGDVVSYDNNGDGKADHVGVVTSYNSARKMYHSVEGNTSLEQLTYKKDQRATAGRVIGFTSPVAR